MKPIEILAEAAEYLELPKPERTEIYCDSSAVLFLNPYGATLRLSDKAKTPLIRSDDIARPIGAFDVSETHRVDLTFGGHLAEYIDSEVVQDNLDKTKIDSMDVLGHFRNCLYLPKTQTPEQPNGKPVTFDPLWLRNNNPDIRNYKPGRDGLYDFTPRYDETPDTQDRLYQDLRDCFTQAVRHEDFSPLWRALETAQNEGRLIDAWNQKLTVANGRNITSIAARYEKRLYDAALDHTAFSAYELKHNKQENAPAP